MICCYNRLYEDETLHSACARYVLRMNRPRTSAGVRELFGENAKSVRVDLPNRLKWFVQHLPPGFSNSCADWIERHTLFPFYRAFWPRGRERQYFDEMVRDRSTSLDKPVLVVSQLSKFLRYCPVCLDEDRAQLGETYWRRLPQIAGCMICPKHQVFFESSSIPSRLRNPQNELVSAEEALSSTPPRKIDLKNSGHQVMLQLAEDAKWILNHTGPFPELSDTQKRYQWLLLERGLGSSQRIVWANLIRELEEFIPGPLVKELNLWVEGQGAWAWLRPLIKSSIHQSSSPATHLLLMQFLGHTPERLLSVLPPSTPFGNGPWPCLNPVAPHFGQLVVTECKVVQVWNRKPSLSGRFACSCGRVYARRRQRSGQTDACRKAFVLQYGSLWDGALRHEWMVGKDNAFKLAKKFGVHLDTIRRQAARLGLPFPRPAHPGSKLTCPDRRSGAQRKRRSKRIECSEKERQTMLEAIAAHPGARRFFFSKKMPGLYQKLRLHDPEWFEAHLPPRGPWKRPSYCCIDWNRRDVDLSQQAREAGERIHRRQGYPVVVTVTKLCREMNLHALPTRDMERLPLTAKVLTDVVDTPERLVARRVAWVQAEFQREGRVPHKTEFILRGRLVLRNCPPGLIQEQVGHAIAELRGSVSRKTFR